MELAHDRKNALDFDPAMTKYHSGRKRGCRLLCVGLVIGALLTAGISWVFLTIAYQTNHYTTIPCHEICDNMLISMYSGKMNWRCD